MIVYKKMINNSWIRSVLIIMSLNISRWPFIIDIMKPYPAKPVRKLIAAWVCLSVYLLCTSGLMAWGGGAGSWRSKRFAENASSSPRSVDGYHHCVQHWFNKWLRPYPFRTGWECCPGWSIHDNSRTSYLFHWVQPHFRPFRAFVICTMRWCFHSFGIHWADSIYVFRPHTYRSFDHLIKGLLLHYHSWWQIVVPFKRAGLSLGIQFFISFIQLPAWR